MSYVVLARKYRPKNFAEMVGQEHVVQALGNALTTRRLHHAYLFTGTRGVGKTTVSRILAKSLNCTGPDGQGGITATPCGVCDACRDIDTGRFVDYTELDAASNRGVDEVQSLLEQAVYKPVQGRFKVFMIDEVHMLTNTAFNAMLKTLEEPPEYLKFVLATTDPQKVPVTVLSRCLQFNLRPMAPDTVREHLAHVLAAEQVAAEPGALRLLARSARGSMRDALSLTDQAIAFGGGQLQEATVRQMLGAVDRSHVWTLLEALAAGDGGTVVQTVEALRLQGFGAASTLEEMVGLLQRMAVAQMVSAAAAGDDPDEVRLQQLATVLPPDDTQLLYSLCLHGRGELGLAPDEYAALTMVLLRLLAFRPEAEKKTLKRPSAAPELAAVRPQAVMVSATPGPASPTPTPVSVETIALAPGPGTSDRGLPELPPPSTTATATQVAPPRPAVDKAPPPEPAEPVTEPVAINLDAAGPGLAVSPRHEPAVAPPAAPQASPLPSVPAELGDFWFQLVQQLVATDAVTALVRELALQSCLVAQREGAWQLQVPGATLMQPSTRDRLQAALAAAGHPVRLELAVGPVDDSPAKRLAAAAAARLRDAEDHLRQDPFVQAMLRDFGGKIVPGSIQAL
ncbi:DNA polymerase III subunit gamma/tau [Aquabacterium sp. A08]|uniref:DNA polymerase III subunit gamma/tau n=1 Tax=Aquabacterium sp. A08 TaxID=2718532 RepID=UPI001423284D|nr:DNA polymerase III subunit gamma/tau [Aquabacterium sp. A08]NIC42740.1 DNA polymerase III subunit gamma/tau [Aquabacterium sp. A08]